MSQGGVAAAVAVAVLVVTAGCGAVGGPGGSGDDARTVNPALRETPTATATPTPGPPPGVGRGNVSVWVVTNAHEDALDGRSVTVRYRRTVVAANGTALATVTETRRRDGDALLYELRTGGANPNAVAVPSWNASVWTNGTWTATRRVFGERGPPGEDGSGGAVRYGTVDGRPAWSGVDGTGADLLRATLAPLTLEYAGTTTRGGERLFVLRATDAWAADGYPSGVSNVSLAAFVTADGVVRSYRLRYDAVYGGVRATSTARFRVTGVGTTTVDRPAWVADAVAAAANGSQNVTAD
ncbi:hypothetical protein [Halobaculum sp. P14]|uniref:hypothetical protein n=1 Tax=Halobaculum sp. P14 TaxID=3421638 RepID=UPI003EB95F3D